MAIKNRELLFIIGGIMICIALFTVVLYAIQFIGENIQKTTESKGAEIVSPHVNIEGLKTLGILQK